MKRTLLFIFIALVVVCGVGGYLLRGKFTAAGDAKTEATATVTRGELSVKVIETGTIDAVKAVEVRSRASGRLKDLYVDEGDMVQRGQLIATIDPQETQFLVEQNQAQLRGAQSSVARTTLEMAQRRITARAALTQAEQRLAQLRAELGAQPTLTRTAINQAQAALASTRQEKQRLDTTIHPNRRTAQQQTVDEAQASYQNAQREFDRIQDLEGRGYVAGRSLDNARLSMELAKVRLQAAKDSQSRLEAELRLELSKADEDVKRAQAELDRATANQIQDVVKRREYESAIAGVNLARAALRDVEVLSQTREQSRATVSQIGSVLRDSQRQLRETKIIAPMNGVVTKRYLEVGELVTALSAFSAGSSLVRVEDRRSMRVKLNVNEIDVARLALDMDAKIDVDAIPNETLSGRVTKIAPASTALAAQGAQQAAAAADSVVKYEVEIVLDQTHPKLRSGMSAKCTLEVLRRDRALLLPLEFVGKDKEGSYVMFAPATKTAQPKRQKVTVGASSGAMVEVLTGVKEGDKVVRPAYTGPKRQGFMQFGNDDQGSQATKDEKK